MTGAMAAGSIGNRYIPAPLSQSDVQISQHLANLPSSHPAVATQSPGSTAGITPFATRRTRVPSWMTATPSTTRSFTSIVDRVARFESLECKHHCRAGPPRLQLERAAAVSRSHPSGVTDGSISEQDITLGAQASEGTDRPHQGSSTSAHRSSQPSVAAGRLATAADDASPLQHFIVHGATTLGNLRSENKEEKGRTRGRGLYSFRRVNGPRVVQVQCELKQPVPFRARDSRRLISLCRRRHSPLKVLWSY